MNILFIGGGNMAQAIIGGLIAQGASASDLQVVEPNDATRASLDRFEVSTSASFIPSLLPGAGEVIMLAVKPQAMREALQPLAGHLTGEMVISIAAGVRCAQMAQWLGSKGDATAGPPTYSRIVRAMPNTPALIRAGVTGLYAMPGVEAAAKQQAEVLLQAVGKTAWFEDEAALDAVTAVSGSGPAYVFYFIEQLEAAAIELGFPPETAQVFALQTFLGSAQLAAHSEESVAVLRERVTSKRGTTERALQALAATQVGAHFGEAVKAAALRARELGDELANSAREGDNHDAQSKGQS